MKVPGSHSTTVQEINDDGFLIGKYGATDGVHGFLKDGGGYSTIDIPFGEAGSLRGLNDVGQIVGEYREDIFDPSVQHGFLYDRGVFSTFDFPGAFSTEPLGINDAHQIVGQYFDVQANHGFVLSGQTYMTVDFPGAVGTTILGINDAGIIVGRFDDGTGGNHGFVAFPESVPIPSTLLLFGTGFAGSVAWRWKAGENI